MVQSKFKYISDAIARKLGKRVMKIEEAFIMQITVTLSICNAVFSIE